MLADAKIGNKIAVKKAGDTHSFGCIATGDSDMTIKWSKDGQEIKGNEGVRKNGKKLGELTISPITNNSSGNYTCYVSYMDTKNASATSQLFVEGMRLFK